MDTSQVTKGLQKLYQEEGARIVFWHDPQREFEETLPDLALEDVQLLRLDEIPALEAKVRLEQEDTAGRYLLYAPFEQPAQEQDWLLDIRLYSGSFRADRASILLGELGLNQQAMRQHLAERAKFFASQERLKKLKKLASPGDSELDIDRKILAVLAKADQPEFFNILISIFHGIPKGNPDALPDCWEDIQKYGVEEAFWQLVDGSFGYREDQPSLKNLLIRLLLSDFAQAVPQALPGTLQHLLLSRPGMANAVVCLGQWRDSSTRNTSYDALSARIADTVKLDQHLGSFAIEALGEVKTFLLVEKFIASRLRDRVIDTCQAINPDEIREIAARRQDGYWATDALPTSANAPRKALHAVYDALLAATDLFDLLNQYPGGFASTSAEKMVADYTGKLFRFDQHYRRFCEAADYAESHDWDILKTLRQHIEDAYGNGYLAGLALAWGKPLEQGLLDRWTIAGLPNQQQFFDDEVKPVLGQAEDRRVFVVISDAFRYEAAEELAGQLNGRYRFEAELSAQLGVLPSYTSLGMAALLPHESLGYTDNGTIQVDGLPCASLEQRKKILEPFDGIAIKAEEFMGMKKDEGRNFIKPYRVVYIYHNKIDAMGDSASTEDHTFEAVRTAINELGDLVGKIVNSLNGTLVLVTADHGFLFQETPPTVTDKNAIASRPAGTVIAKKRYLLGKNLPDNDKAWHGRTAITAGAAGDMEFWVPKGANRFHFIGGARFVHGGAMPQEIIVPLIRVRQLKGKTADKTKTTTVGVSVLGSKFKVTTNRHRFKLIQTSAVSERVKPITLKVAIYEGEQPVTNVETLTFDSASRDMNEWQKTVNLTLESRAYDKQTAYQLVLRDAETGVDEARFDVTIDLAFTNDF